MKRLMLTLAIAVAVAACLPALAQASFGLKPDRDITFTVPGGSPSMQAGSHPYQMTTTLNFNTTIEPEFGEVPDGAAKDITIDLPPGQVADPAAVPTCPTATFLAMTQGQTSCPDETALGKIAVGINTPGEIFTEPVYNLAPPPGTVIELGFVVVHTPVSLDIGLKNSPPYNGVVGLTNISQIISVYSSKTTIWGDPASSAHDAERGRCLKTAAEDSCPANIAERPFLTLPRSCPGPLQSNVAADSWQDPGARLPNGEPDLSDPAWLSYQLETHDNANPPQPLGTTGCSKLGFKPSIVAKPTTKAANSPSGLDFSLDVNDEGLTNPKEEATAQSDIKKAVVTLPEGFTANPSLAEGLNVCTEADLDRETVNSTPGAGCPEASKIGTVEVESPLIDESVNGTLYVAAPFENEFHSLLALYMVIKNPTLGIVVKQALKVEPNPITGQLTTIAENLPQLPFSHFKLHFREGTRSPLASPPLCGTYNASAELTPWSGGAPITTTSAFQIISGPDAGPCPSGGVPPFHPALNAGTLNNAAGRYSPFNLRLSRTDSEQEITHFSIKLPPGLLGKLAGIPFCSDAAIAAAKARTGPHGGQEELEHPSCPAASEVGRTLVGAGVGPSLAYVPGKIYLAGPYHGSALSIAAITSGVAGPFDLGTVVVRQALKINPETAEVFIDATGSDPIPHIIQGIPVHLRDIRAYVDRPEFVLNPTNCTRTSTASTVLGSGLDFGSEVDDQPITVTSPFQAADCASLGFAPKLALNLKGGTKRGDTPAFKAVLTYPKGYEANVQSAQVTLPHSVFLEQSHIKTICTRVQFAAGKGNGEGCPPASIYGHAQAITPLLDEALEGPVFLRSSSHNLPDLVAALNSGKIDVALDGHIDSVKGGRIRNTFEAVPDAPVSKFTLEMQGGKKGLLVNSTDLCKGTNRAISHFVGQNGKVFDTRPVLGARCGGKAKKGKGKGQRRSH